jgi:hypothetical protein
MDELTGGGAANGSGAAKEQPIEAMAETTHALSKIASANPTTRKTWSAKMRN